MREVEVKVGEGRDVVGAYFPALVLWLREGWVGRCQARGRGQGKASQGGSLRAWRRPGSPVGNSRTAAVTSSAVPPDLE